MAQSASTLAAGEPLAVARFFWPDLLVREGWVFLADGFSDDALAVWKDSDFFKKAGMRGVSAAMNHRHVADLLPSASKLGDESFDHLGYVIGSCWEMRIRRAFPERQFQFEFGEEIWFWEGPPD